MSLFRRVAAHPEEFAQERGLFEALVAEHFAFLETEYGCERTTASIVGNLAYEVRYANTVAEVAINRERRPESVSVWLERAAAPSPRQEGRDRWHATALFETLGSGDRTEIPAELDAALEYYAMRLRETGDSILRAGDFSLLERWNGWEC
jgi:hypothetical protein